MGHSLEQSSAREIQEKDRLNLHKRIWLEPSLVGSHQAVSNAIIIVEALCVCERERESSQKSFEENKENMAKKHTIFVDCLFRAITELEKKVKDQLQIIENWKPPGAQGKE